MNAKKYENVIQVIPSAQMYYDRAMKAFEKRDIHKAISQFKKGISLAKTEDDALFGQVQVALMMQHTQDFYESIALFNQLLERTNNKYPELYYFQAANYIHVEELETALSLIEFYLERSPKGSYAPEAIEMKQMIEYRLSGM